MTSSETILAVVAALLLIERFYLIRSFGTIIKDLSSKIVSKDSTEYISYQRSADYKEPKVEEKKKPQVY